MGNLIFAAAAGFVLWWLSRNYKKYETLRFAKIGKSIVGGLFVGAGVVLLAKGQLLPAVLGFGVGSSLLGWDIWAFFSGRGSARMSRFTASSVSLELDNLTGQMDGTVRRGPFTGRRLSRMTQEEIGAVLNDAAQIADAAAVELLQAYLYRRFSGGPEQGRGTNPRSANARRPGTITEQEAYEILGLKAGAGTEEIKGAYRTLMKKLHPDLGGTAYLAARVNEAKDALLKRPG